MITPIADRELLVASRRPVIWKNRFFLTLAAMLVSSGVLYGDGSSESAGRRAFEFFAVIAFIYCLASGFIFTSGSIQQERRDGTFGLLYLTPLSSWDVITGKLVAHSLQAVFGLIALIPILVLSLLAGGVTGRAVFHVSVVLLATMAVSLTAGMFASARTGSMRGGFGVTALLMSGALFGGIGVILAGVLAFPTEEGQKRKAFVIWLTGYLTLFAVMIWLFMASGEVITGSPALAFSRALRDLTSAEMFNFSIAALVITACYYLFSATLCTEWYRVSHEKFVSTGEDEHEVDDLFFPGLRAKGPVGNDPAHWILSFLQTTPFVFFLLVGILTLCGLASPSAPGGLGHLEVAFAWIPFVAFSVQIANFNASAFHTLERSGLLETLITTPLRIVDLVRAQRRIYWSALWVPILTLFLGSILGIFATTSASKLSWDRVLLLICSWSISWVVLALQLEINGLLAMSFALKGRKPPGAAIRSFGISYAPQIGVFILAHLLWRVAAQSSDSADFHAVRIFEDVLAIIALGLVLRWAKGPLGLERGFLRP